MNQPSECWLPIPDYVGYEASSLGRIRSYRPINGKGKLLDVPRYIKPTLMTGKPYYQLTLSKGNGERKQVRLHLIILETFYGPRPSNDYEGCHNNGDPSDNSKDNLRWDTRKANSDDQYKHGTRIMGSKHPVAVLNEEQVLQIKAALPDWKRGMGKMFAELYGVRDTTISSIVCGHTWSHL